MYICVTNVNSFTIYLYLHFNEVYTIIFIKNIKYFNINNLIYIYNIFININKIKIKFFVYNLRSIISF